MGDIIRREFYNYTVDENGRKHYCPKWSKILPILFACISIIIMLFLGLNCNLLKNLTPSILKEKAIINNPAKIETPARSPTLKEITPPIKPKIPPITA